MNRGHAYMIRFHSPAVDKHHAWNTLVFLGYNQAGERWFWGEGDSHSESIRLFDGELRAHLARS